MDRYLVHAIDAAATSWGVSRIFIGAVVIPIAGNAAEHYSAITVAYVFALASVATVLAG